MWAAANIANAPSARNTIWRFKKNAGSPLVAIASAAVAA